MKIETAANHVWGRNSRQPMSGDSNQPAFASLLMEASTASSLPVSSSTSTTTESTINFASATRQEMFDWMNSQIRSGAMTLDESTPFLGMTLKISVATGESVNMATDDERIDFRERATRGIEGALSRFDFEAADRLRAALDIMQRSGDNQ